MHFNTFYTKKIQPLYNEHFDKKGLRLIRKEKQQLHLMLLSAFLFFYSLYAILDQKTGEHVETLGTSIQNIKQR